MRHRVDGFSEDVRRLRVGGLVFLLQNVAEPRAVAQLRAEGCPDDEFYRVLGYLRKLARGVMPGLSLGELDTWSPAMVEAALAEVEDAELQ